MIARFRSLYGAGPLHLLALLASFLLAGAAVVRWFDPGTNAGNILVWFLAALIGHDLVLLPLYSLLDRVAFGPRRLRPPDPPPAPRAGVAYVRAPLLLSTLLAFVFLPLLLGLGNKTFHDASGMGTSVYLGRWLWLSGGLFALSGLAYAMRLARGRRPARG